MTILSYRPSDDQFWIACNKEEAERWFIPLLDEQGMDDLNGWLNFIAKRRRDYDKGKGYEDLIKEAMEVDEIAYAYFNVSHDLSICYASVAQHPFHQLWNGDSPFHRCDHLVISAPEELKTLEMTFKGKPIKEMA